VRPLRIFFATDIHGSETCFRKFINAGQAYQADALVMGGDITGKMIVLLVAGAGGIWSVQWLGARRTVTGDELAALEKEISMAGCYPYRTTPEEVAALEADPDELKRVFRTTMQEAVRRWLLLAEERLRGTGIECYVTPGNDDDLFVDQAFASLNGVTNPESRLVHIKGEVEMISSGYSNRTPWNSPRELEEEQLAEKISALAAQLQAPQRAIFNFHCPPYDVGLDTAPRLDATLKPVTGIGGVQMIPVGSTAVLEAITHFRPLLGLHGHIHESRGAVKVGPTLCVNPGSEYTEGILRGCLVLLDGKRVRDYLLTSG